MSETSAESAPSRAQTPSPGPRAGWPVLWVLLALIPIFIFAVMIWQRRWMSDDGFINLRVVQNLLAGQGPVFNIGERVEAYTSTLWLGFLTLFSAPGIRPERVAVYGGFLLSLVGAFSATWAAATLHQWNLAGRATRAGMRRFLGVLPLGMLTYAVLPPAWDYGTSGLETGMSLAWLGGSFALLVYLAKREFYEPESADLTDEEPAADSPGNLVYYGAAFVLGLAPLIRPELQLFCLGFMAPLLLLYFGRARGGFTPLRLLKIGCALGALPVAYQLFRMGYFAALVPNTAYAKEAFESHWGQGANFFGNFFFRYWLLFPIALLGVFWARSLSRARSQVQRLLSRELPRSAQAARLRFLLLLIPAICGVGYCAYVVKVGGGFMHGRLFLPGVFGMLLPVMVVPVYADKKELKPAAARLGYALAAALLGWAAICGLKLRVPVENEHGIGDERGWYAREAKRLNPVLLEDYEEMYFTRRAQGILGNASRSCRQLFAERGGFFEDVADARKLGGGWRPDEGCRPTVDARILQSTTFDELYPSARVFDVDDAYIERGTALVVMQTAMGMQGLLFGPHTHLVDRVGLASPLASRLELARRGRPGHEKSLSSPWMIGRFAAPQEEEDPRVMAARQALECGALKDLMDATNAPMSFGRFAKNLGAAFRFHTLRIPTDPLAARRTFCDLPAPEIVMSGGKGGKEVKWECAPGYALSSLGTRIGEREDTLAQLRPECRPITNLDELEAKGGDFSAKLSGHPAQAPAFGEHNTTSPVSLHCPMESAIVGLRGKADRFVEEVAPICASEQGDEATPEMPPNGEAGPDAEPFEVRCPEGTLAIGFAGRAGALVDAVGLICAAPGH